MTVARSANALRRIGCGQGPDDRACVRVAAQLQAIEHLPRYLAELSYRFNRRVSLPVLFPRLASVASPTASKPYRVPEPAENDA